ncbi:MAG: hypothetical protein AB1437_25180, partial [Pseudomonadota bacterium]
MHTTLARAGLAAMLLAPLAHAQQGPATEQDRSQELATLKAELAAQRELVDKLMREVQAQRAKIERIEQRRDDPETMLADSIALPPRIDDGQLDEQRGTGGQGQQNQQQQQPPRVAQNQKQ